MRLIAAYLSLVVCAPLYAAEIIRYAGSSTIAKFIADAAPVYGEAVFELATRPESAGGEACALARTCDIGGVAREVDSAVLAQGVTATLIGHDAIAVVVNSGNPVTVLESDTLARIFTGQVARWSELGGPDLPVEPYVVSPRSATHGVFRDVVLAGREYAGVTIVKPDSRMPSIVASRPGAIGQISFSFLGYDAGIRALDVDGQKASVENAAYPIARPLYLLTHGERRDEVDRFIRWVLGPEGQAVIRGQFVGGERK
jgi:phosphate transport system substrate-binding protein